MASFELQSEFEPAGDQPAAIHELCEGLDAGRPHQVLMGITGSGKTLTMAHVIAHANVPTLVLAHNKTLVAQLYSELKALFPQNAVEYFVSYFDYYQPEAYVPSTDTYIEKDSSINEQIDKLRHAATRSLLERNDVIIVASVSCIYGLGSPDAYHNMVLQFEPGQTLSRQQILARLVEMQYQRNEIDFRRGTFRAKGDIIDIFPSHEQDLGIRVELWGDEVESLSEIDPLTGARLQTREKCCIYPASHYVTPRERIEGALRTISDELEGHLSDLEDKNMLLEAQRLEQRTRYDLEMIEELGYCTGVENYSRHFTGLDPGDPPPNLLSYFPPDWLLIVDEAHQTIPQVGGMYKGDHNRKATLVRHGFRLPSALDNRPLKFAEFESRVNQAIYLSATPGDYELEKAAGVVVEQIIRPTGLLDPQIEVRPAEGQIDDLLDEIRKTTARGNRVLVTTLTKRLAQDITTYYEEAGVRVRYLHSDIQTLERMEILRELRLGDFDVLVGINLLREGLDLPEVELVAVLDADREGFLRSTRSLIQVVGRAARNIDGRAILYGDTVTRSMGAAMGETSRRREKQEQYNKDHGIEARSVVRSVDDPIAALLGTGRVRIPKSTKPAHPELDSPRLSEVPRILKKLRLEMKAAAEKLEFERAAEVRDRLRDLEQWALELSGELPT